MDVSKKYSFNSKLTTLAKKLTPQERNNVIQFYEVANKATTDFGRGYKAALLRIFGKKMFENKLGDEKV